ncbi:ribosomal protein L1p/L10e family-domain-containing protein [Trametes gibbosa]|nr:ribosomal protein L1p/L10e family-domain-containing protein [Trametes gibbosa]
MSGGLIDNHVSTQQCSRAVEALLSHVSNFEEKKAENQLLPGKEQNVWLVVNTKLMYPEKKIKPARIPVKYPIVDPRTSPVCLVTKDPQREYKDLIAERGIKFISRVVDIKHLKGKWKPFEARRMLLKENGLFLADERVVPMLPALLGKKFFDAKKQPIPVCLTRVDLKGELERAISSTYFHQNQGTCTSVKIGTVSQKPTQVLDNLQTALPEVVKHIKGGWENVQSLFIKTNSSAALPIWQCDLGSDAGGRWEGLIAGASEDEDEDMDDAEESAAEEEIVVEKPAVGAKTKGKKRAAEEAEVEKEQPKKKAKAAVPSTKSSTIVKETKVKAAESAPAAPPGVLGSEPAPAAADAEKKPRRRKSKAGAEPAIEPTVAATASSASITVSIESTDAAAPAEGSQVKPAKKQRHKKARASLTAGTVEASDATAPAPDAGPSIKTDAVAAPATPSVPRKKRRASAVDFFEDPHAAAAATPATAARPAVPPNTPADGLAPSEDAETPASGKRKKRTKGAAVADTPVTTAIAKFAAAEPAQASAEAETPSGKKPRKRKQQKEAGGEGEGEGGSAPVVTAPTAPAPAAEETPVKKPKRKQLKAAAAAVEAAVVGLSPSASAEEINQKKSAVGVEKKKVKFVGARPGAKSAKDAVVGKKRL